MEFGFIQDLQQVDFALPADSVLNDKVWNQAKLAKAEYRVGCAKWDRDDWRGTLYTPTEKKKDYLKVYAQKLQAIEFNAAFYAIPTTERIELWKSQVGRDFLFFPKMSKQITHDADTQFSQAYTHAFLSNMRQFGPYLGGCFIQFEESFSTQYSTLLLDYLRLLPQDIQFYIELRHADWFKDTDTTRSFYEELLKIGVGMVITDTAGRRDCVHQRLTIPKTFIRFVGNGLVQSDYTRIDDWVERLHSWQQKGIEEVNFFIHQHNELHSPRLCAYLIEQLNVVCKTEIPPLSLYQDKQTKLF